MGIPPNAVQTFKAGVSLSQYAGHGSNLAKGHLRITGIIAHFLFPPLVVMALQFAGSLHIECIRLFYAMPRMAFSLSKNK
jgi:hypothetical protein